MEKGIFIEEIGRMLKERDINIFIICINEVEKFLK